MIYTAEEKKTCLQFSAIIGKTVNLMYYMYAKIIVSYFNIRTSSCIGIEGYKCI